MIAIACETLNRLFSTNEDRLVKQVSGKRKLVRFKAIIYYIAFKAINVILLQALDAEMVPYLLNILEGRLDIVENPATTKAQIVKALKAMTKSLLLGEKVNAILEKSSVWAEYKDQRHDLFISNNTSSGYLTGIIYTNNFNTFSMYSFCQLLDVIQLEHLYLLAI